MRLQQIKEHRLGRQARMNPSESGEAYILSGKVVCGECGRAFIRKKEQRRKGVSIKWRCPGHRSEACQCYTNEIWEEDIKNTFVNAFNTLVGHADELFGPIIQGVKRIQEANGLHEESAALNQKKLELKRAETYTQAVKSK